MCLTWTMNYVLILLIALEVQIPYNPLVRESFSRLNN